MPVEESNCDDVRKIILSLLLSRKGSTPLGILEDDYYKLEGKRIPWRKFGYTSLVEFLDGMPQYFKVERRNGNYYVYGIPSEKTKHVSSLVSRQKNYLKPHKNYWPHRSTVEVQRRKIRMPAQHLKTFVQYVKNNPRGVNMQTAIATIRGHLPHFFPTIEDMREQLRELPHQLYLDGDLILPVESNNSQNTCNQSVSESWISHASSPCQVTYGVPEDDIEKVSSQEDNYSAHTDGMSNPEQRSTEYEDIANNEGLDASSLISDRVKSRLQQLVEKYPDGIWCADLPDVYLNEYKVPLKYTDLGFNSVREYVSYLPTIFHIEQKLPMGDFMVYSADKKPRNSASFDDCRNMNDDEPVPAILSPMICEKFAPDGVMSYNETVSYIPVTELEVTKKSYQEVYVVEVFTPSFFWIHLRKNRKHFDIFMNDLHKFYQSRSHEFIIPKVALKKGLNCACVYAGIWHRGIIQSVKPDFKITVMFYDYGTLKTYEAHEIYYLYKAFSHLPAQAIACGLYNVRPYIGDRWKKSITDRFIDKVSEYLLAATVVSVDSLNNTMMIILTDTSEEYDVRINDWLVKENLAQHGKMGDAVDMSSLMNYVVNSHNTLPSYCYAEENLMPDNHVTNYTKATSVDEIPLISPEHNVSCSHQQLSQLSSEFPTTNGSNLESKLNIDPFKVETNPFLIAQPIDINELDKETFMQIWRKNAELQIKLMRLFLTFLNSTPVSKVLYETFLAAGRHFNETFQRFEDTLITNLEKPLVPIQDDRYKKDMSNTINEQFMNVLGTSFTHEDVSRNHSLASMPKNESVVNGDGGKTNSTISDSNTSFITTNDRIKTQIAQHISFNGIQSSYLYKATDAFKNMCLQDKDKNLSEQKETNPFRLSAMNEIETQDVWNEQERHTTMPSFFDVNLQNCISKNHVANINVKSIIDADSSKNYESLHENKSSNGFLHAIRPCDTNSSEEFIQNITNENDRAKYYMQERVKSNMKQYDCSNYNNDCDIENESLRLVKNEKNSGRDLLLKVASYINNIDLQYSKDEFASSLNCMQKSSAMINHESDMYDRYLSLDNSRYDSKAHHTTSVTSYRTDPCLSNVQQDKNCLEAQWKNIAYLFTDVPDKKSTIQSSNGTHLNQANSNNDKCIDEEKRIAPTFTSHKRVPRSYAVSPHNIFSFREIHSVKGITFIFHTEDNGWILTQEFVKTFTIFNSCAELKMTLQIFNIKIDFKNIKRSQHPLQFLQLDSYPIDVERNPQKCIICISIIQLGAVLELLYKLNILSNDEIDAFDKNIFMTDSRLQKIWNLIEAYKEFRENIEQYNANYRK